jgi:glyoxylase-like metal-dependent hydrolase (beta-lactamase superfamily II)
MDAAVDPPRAKCERRRGARGFRPCCLIGLSGVFAGALLAACGSDSAPIVVEEASGIGAPQPAGGFRIWQARNADSNPNNQSIMSYVIQTGVKKQIIVIDGGINDQYQFGAVGDNSSDATQVRNFVTDLNAGRENRIHMWFISHQHLDHFGALANFLRPSVYGQGPSIDAIYGSFFPNHPDRPGLPWDEATAPWDSAREIWHELSWKDTVRRAGDARVPIVELSLHEVLTLDDVKIEVFRVSTPVLTDDYCRANPPAPHGCTQFGSATRVGIRINNSSVVLRVSDASRSILFTGDLGANGASYVLSTVAATRLKSDYVQMMHHGNASPAIEGAPVRQFYEVVGARYCLWPTAANFVDIFFNSDGQYVSADDRCGPKESGRHFYFVANAAELWKEIVPP